jgi:hypothetical protein
MTNTPSIHDDETSSWRGEMLECADQLDRQAAITRLIAQADDAEDAALAALDVAAAITHCETIRQRGLAATSPPAPSSRLFRRLVDALRDKLSTIVDILEVTERRRLQVLAPRFFASLTAGEPDVVEAIVDLAPQPPEVIALWLQLHLKTIEMRFAS